MGPERGRSQHHVVCRWPIDSPEVAAGDTILVGPGNHAGAFVTKPVGTKGEDDAVINNGPVHPSGLVQGFRLLTGSDGAVISHLRFEVDLAIMNGDATNDVTLTHGIFENTIQAFYASEHFFDAGTASDQAKAPCLRQGAHSYA